MASQVHVFLADGSVTSVTTTILDTKSVPDGLALALTDNIFRSAGGGEPADRGGAILAGGTQYKVVRVEKSEGKTWIVLPPPAAAEAGARITASVDAPFRDSRRKLHTLVHIVLAVATRRLPGLVIESAEIADDATNALIVASGQNPVSPVDLVEIDCEARSVVLSARPVLVAKAKSVEDAKAKYDTFRISERYALTGRLRLIVIDGLDANPCSGIHHSSTDVGAYELTAVWEPTQPNRCGIRLRPTASWTYWFGGGRAKG